jgi:glycosyltransferase involved in cell wall biosynthesis/SAM-dependent methyltransferase
MIKVAAFTPGRNIPSARFRVRQYIDALHAHDIEVSEFPASLGAYPPKDKFIRAFWAVGSLSSRLPSVVESYRYDVTLFQREMLSTFATLERLTKKPRVLDVDDAIWLYRKGGFARRLARMSEAVICGNSFLAEQFGQWNSNIFVLPTAVDTERFKPLSCKGCHANDPDYRPTIGWSGSQSGFPDLQLVEEALQLVLKRYPRARLRVIADEPPQLRLPASQFEFVRWSPETEVETIQSFDIGIMPLRDSLWSRGKCAYKMLLYMSCGVPVVVSPVGMTADVFQMDSIGASARTTEGWIDAFSGLLERMENAVEMGQRAREVVLRNFSIHTLAPQLAENLAKIAGRQTATAAPEVNGRGRVSDGPGPSHAMQTAPELATGSGGVEALHRFEFGRNWRRFLSQINRERVEAAASSLQQMLDCQTLKGKTFLDVGSGSGLFSLAARQLGASVLSFDNDPESVACTRQLKQMFFPGDARWNIEQGSVLDRTYLDRMGSFDIVYAWGVLHHSGAMWEALDNMPRLVKREGALFVAIYDDQGRVSDFWRFVKRTYNRFPRPLRFAILWPVALFFLAGMTLVDIGHLRRLRVLSKSTDPRGMSVWTDIVDWVGGYPFEVASADQIIRACGSNGLRLNKLVASSRKLGCNQYIFVKCAEGRQQLL